MDRRARVARGGRERCEIDMGGQIGGPWRRKRIGRAAIADRLKTVAKVALFRPIVEEKRGARMGGQTRTQALRNGQRRFIQFENCLARRPLPPPPSRKGRESQVRPPPPLAGGGRGEGAVQAVQRTPHPR